MVRFSCFASALAASKSGGDMVMETTLVVHIIHSMTKYCTGLKSTYASPPSIALFDLWLNVLARPAFALAQDDHLSFQSCIAHAPGETLWSLPGP